jgi:hypothetical protein
MMLCSIAFATAQDLTRNQQLILACYRVDVRGVTRHLRAGADPRARFGNSNRDELIDPWEGGAPIACGQWTSLMALCNAPEYPNPPAHIQRIWEDPNRVRDEQSRIGREALDVRRLNELAIMYILLSHGAKFDEDDGLGSSCLHMAVDHGKVRLVRELLDWGANPNTKERVHLDGADNITPLHSACRSKELLQLLLDHGADPTAKDGEGRTPGDWVALDVRRDFDLIITSQGPRIVAREK